MHSDSNGTVVIPLLCSATSKACENSRLALGRVARWTAPAAIPTTIRAPMAANAHALRFWNRRVRSICARSFSISAVSNARLAWM